MSKYPVYIVSKGRFENPITAKCFIKDGVDFKILVEPQEYEDYKKALPEKYIMKLPFSNLGLGSYPARNFAFEDSIKNGAERHWCFDDNIYGMRMLNNGKRIPINAKKAIEIIEDFTDRYKNIAISGFNYTMFVMDITKQPFFYNVHAYSAMLLNNKLPYRWRLKYNEDVDICLQVLDAGYCTVLFNAVCVDKVSTTAGMKGGNQSELYKNNDYDKQVLKARSLEAVWPQYAETVFKFNRPHHKVDWKKHFKQQLIRRKDIDFDKMSKVNNFGLKLKKIR